MKLKFRPAFLFSNGFLQTVMYGFMNHHFYTVPEYVREVFDFKDGGACALDWVYSKKRSKGIVMIVPGLTGNSSENYALSIVYKAINEGYNPVVVSHRGCSGVKIQTAKMYCAGSSWDLREVAHHIQKEYPNDRLFAVGFSLGANILAKFCGEDGKDCILDGAVCISSPLDMEKASAFLESEYYGLFTWFLANNIKKKILEHSEMIPLVEEKYNINVEKILSECKTLRDIDDQFTAKVFNFGDWRNYYRSVRSSNFLHNIHTKTLFISALDDPVTGQD